MKDSTMNIKSENVLEQPENDDILSKEVIKPHAKPYAQDTKTMSGDKIKKECSGTDKTEVKQEVTGENDIKVGDADVKTEKNSDSINEAILTSTDKIQETKDSIISDIFEVSKEEILSNSHVETIAEDGPIKTDNDTAEAETETKIPENNKNAGKAKSDSVNVSKPTKRKRCRPAQRKRYKRVKRVKVDQPKIDIAVENISSPEATVTEDVEYSLAVTNLPNNWSFMDIKNYIDTQCGPVDEIEMVKDDNTSNGAIRLSYQNESECREAMKKLKDKEVEGNKIVVTMTVESLDSDSEVQSVAPQNVSEVPETPEAPEPPGTTYQKPWRPDLDVWEIDPEGLYGLKKTFLTSLGITPPLDKWIHVSNFRCDKSELREVLEMAGNVIMCSVFNSSPKYANVMYSHPLEAVQAVSMLNGQPLYGQTLKVVMDRSPLDTILLPKGLTTIGVGLGAYGKPLRNITKHYHRFVSNQSASINRAAFEDTKNMREHSNGTEEPENVTFTVKSVADFNYVMPSSTPKSTPVQNTPVSKTSTNTTGTQNSAKVQTKLQPQTQLPKPVTKTTQANNVIKSQVTVQKPFVPPPSRSPARQQFQPQNNMQPQNFGTNYGQFNPPRPFGPDPRMARGFGPGPRPGWNGPGPMGSGPMGPGPMGPGPMGPGAMGGPRPMGPGPMGGQRPIGPGLMGPGPMGGPRPMPGPMPGQMPGQMPGPMAGQMQGPMAGQMPGPMAGQMPGQMPVQIPGCMPGGPQMYPVNEPVQLQLSNLPPSTTFAILCEKMAACGSVVSIQLTTPGCAVVTFANRMQANSCFQSYNNMCIEGHVIQVKYT